MNKCIECGKDFVGKRSTARYCSDRCRKLAFQNSVPEVSVPVFDENANSTGSDADFVSDPVLTYTGGDGCGCGMCKNNESRPLKERKIINHGDYKMAGDLAEGEINRVSVPGDVDYDGCMIYVDGAWHQG